PYSPNEFKDPSGKIVGFDVDLVDAVGKVLGVTPEYTEADFDKIIPSIQAGSYDMGMSSFTDTKEREQSVDFTTYFSAGVQWAQPAGKSVDPTNACGLRVGVQTTTIEDLEEVPAKSAACVAAGKPPIEIVKFDSQDDAASAVALGKVDAMSADSPVTAYAIKQSEGKIEAAGEVFDAAPYGWPVAKGSPLAQTLQQALQHLIDDGTYRTIAENWGVEAGVITTSQINGATS
ncbi:MAG: ABC transporter substrate-binding protein, partial [Rhodococcus sp. (in: high G+C Gram-positive bacteria)]